jgi:hypothetical protein
MSVEIRNRVDRLEAILGEFIVQTNVSLTRLERSIEAFKVEMKEFKDEMREFKDEMRMFKEETKEENKRKNREWSNLAKKMGTIVEDLIAPALRPVLSKYFNCDVNLEGQRMFRRVGGIDYEIDAIAACDDKVFMIEAKSTPKFKDIEEIIDKKERFFEFFSEHKDKELIVIFGSITFTDDVIRQASKNKVYALGWKEWEYMDILNFQEIKI